MPPQALSRQSLGRRDFAGDFSGLQDPSSWAVSCEEEDCAVRVPPASLKVQRAHQVNLSPARLRSGSGNSKNSNSSQQDLAERPSTNSNSLHAGNGKDPKKGWTSEESTHTPARTRFNLDGQATSSTMQAKDTSTMENLSVSEYVMGESQKPKGALSIAARFFGLTQTVDNATNEELAAEVLELALAVCDATAPDISIFVEAFSKEDRRALRRLSSTGQRVGLFGRTYAMDIPVPMSEMTSVFLQENRRERFTSEGGPVRYKKTTTAGSFTPSYVGSVVTSSTNAKGQRVVINEDSTEVEEKKDQPRRQSLIRNATGSKSTLGFPSESSAKFGANHRSFSDLSCSSFTDYNRKHHAPKRSGTGISVTARPSFLDFLYSLKQKPLMSQRESPVNGKDGVHMVMDINLPPSRSATKGFGGLDTVSEAGVSYHSANAFDAVLGVDIGEKEVVQAEVLTGDNDNQGKMRIAFKSKCLRTQNEWQRQLLTQQRSLLKMVSSRLKETEQSKKADDELLDEQKELLRGFRKIIIRDVVDEASRHMVLYILEADDDVRDELEELCRILEYPSSGFTDFQETVMAIQENVRPEDMAVGRVLSGASVESAWSTTSRRGSAPLLDGRPGADIPDWRSKKLNTAIKKIRSPEENTIKIVLLSVGWLHEELPKDWQKEGVFVVLTSQAEEFEEVGRQLLAAGEAEIREKLRSRGISDYLLHPLSLDCLRGVVNKAFRQCFGDEYLLLQAMGRGVSGVVHKAKRLSSGDIFALKEINTKRLGRNARQDVEREGKLLQELKWPTVVFLIDTWENHTDRLRYLLMPLLEGGNMLSFLDASQKDPDNPQPTPNRICEWYAQTLHGLTYLHWRGVMHRDLKPGNLLLGLDERTLQIGDLGSAMLLPGIGPHPSRWNKVKAAVCTPLYAAPEVLLEETYNAGSDIWACGATYYEALTFRTVFEAGTAIIELQEQCRKFDFVKGPCTRYLSQVANPALPPAIDLAELMTTDCMKRPAASNLVARSVTYKQLRTVLGEIGALPTPADRQAHFEDLAIVRRESLAAEDAQPMLH